MKFLLSIAVLAALTVGCSSDDKNDPSTGPGANHAPQIVSVTASPNNVRTGSGMYAEVTRLNCIATDSEDDSLRFNWSCTFGRFDDPVTAQSPNWRADGYIQIDTVFAKVIVSDGRSIDTDSVAIRVTR